MQTQPVILEAAVTLPSAEDGQLAWLPVNVIAPRAGHNPRRHFDLARMRELVESIRGQGVIQPIVVRAIDAGRYQIIAGERRWRAAREAGLDEIPAFVRVVDDLQSMQMSMVENTHRDDLAPSEEAQKARDLLTLCHGDRDEARRRLGWSASKLDSRLALLHCTPAVLEALDTRRLTLGHGELLATLAPDTQDGTLPRILEQGISIAQLRERIGQVALPLGRAIFDQAACQGCAHNSEVQGQLFATHIDSGQCSNPKCYGDKTRLVLEARKQAMAQEVAAVWLDTERAPETYAVLEATGALGVGPQQLTEGCRQCAHFGVLIATAPGQEGRLTEDLCFNLACRAEKQQGYRRLLETPQGAPAASSTKRLAAAPKQPAAESPHAEATPQKVQDMTDTKLRAITADLAQEDGRVARAVRLFALLRDAGYTDTEKLGVAAVPTARASAMATLVALADDQCVALEAALVRYILMERSDGDLPGATVAILATTKTDLTQRFRVDEPFLRAHRKAGMDALLREAGFAAWYDATHGEARYARLLQGKVDTIITAALVPDAFDWSGFVPQAVVGRFKALAERT
ncbi:PRTRC system ParB family protein [uncultured Thiodictyon sp.]|uniref:PRTRC system ParB family protein n=1 Tax=uncultured Thiodictyon sp. TaxID=1846217 RepID=UPI0025CEB44B|nr:PRTRC system ParB family protein [uncultured Thiodictyon sp.]